MSVGERAAGLSWYATYERLRVEWSILKGNLPKSVAWCYLCISASTGASPAMKLVVEWKKSPSVVNIYDKH